VSEGLYKRHAQLVQLMFSTVPPSLNEADRAELERVRAEIDRLEEPEYKASFEELEREIIRPMEELARRITEAVEKYAPYIPPGEENYES